MTAITALIPSAWVADLSAAFAETKAADEAILGIARLLPAPLRGRIGQTRGSLWGSIVALKQMAKRPPRNRDHQRPEK